MEGERIDTLERMVVSPAAGVFSAAPRPPSPIDVGTTIGFVGAVPVRSPFAGHLVAVDAVEGERLARHQRVAWLRATPADQAIP